MNDRIEKLRFMHTYSQDKYNIKTRTTGLSQEQRRLVIESEYLLQTVTKEVIVDKREGFRL